MTQSNDPKPANPSTGNTGTKGGGQGGNTGNTGTRSGGGTPREQATTPRPDGLTTKDR